VHGNTDKSEGINEYPCAKNSGTESYVAQTIVENDREESVKADKENKCSRCQVSSGNEP
jgi:hypothetical protein